MLLYYKPYSFTMQSLQQKRKDKMPLQELKQTQSDACVATCCAMLLNRPVEEVIEEFHKDFTNYLKTTDEYLAEQGVKVRRTEDRTTLLFNRIYMLLVPSINTPGMFHQILADTRHGKVVIYDPSRNLRYSMEPQGEMERQLMSWVIDYEVVEAPALDYKLEGDI